MPEVVLLSWLVAFCIFGAQPDAGQGQMLLHEGQHVQAEGEVVTLE